MEEMSRNSVIHNVFNTESLIYEVRAKVIIDIETFDEVGIALTSGGGEELQGFQIKAEIGGFFEVKKGIVDLATKIRFPVHKEVDS